MNHHHDRCLHPAGQPRRGRSDHAAGDPRRLRDHRRGDGPRPLPDVLLLDHPREPGPRRRPLRHRLQHALRVGVDADAHRLDPGLPARHRGDARGWRVVRGRRRRPQPPLLRVEPHARPRHRRAGFPAAAASSASPPTPRTMSISARRRPASSSTCRTSSPKACSSPAPSSTARASRTGRCGTSSAATPAPPASSSPTSRRRSPRRGSGRSGLWSSSRSTARTWSSPPANQLMDYSERLMRQRIAEIPDGDYVAEGWLDDDGRNRDQRLKVKVTVRVRGRRRRGRPDRLRRPDPDRLQRALRGLDQGRGLLRLPQAAARPVTSDVRAPVERGLVPADQGDGAARLDLQPEGSRLGRGALHPVQPDDRPDPAGRSPRSCRSG